MLHQFVLSISCIARLRGLLLARKPAYHELQGLESLQHYILYSFSLKYYQITINMMHAVRFKLFINYVKFQNIWTLKLCESVAAISNLFWDFYFGRQRVKLGGHLSR